MIEKIYYSFERIRFKIQLFISRFDLSSFLLNLVIFLSLSCGVYLIKKFNLISSETTTNFISLTIYVLTLYGIFFAFLQFLIGNNSNKFFFWGINKIEFSILNKFIYRLVNTFATKLIIITFVIIPIAIFIIKELKTSVFSDTLLILTSIWQVCLTYLIILFGFLITQSLTALFIVFKIENNSDQHIKHRIKKFILKQALLGLKKGYFWDYFDFRKKSIENGQLLNFIGFVYKEALKHIISEIPKSKQKIYSYHKKSKMPLDIFLNERWKHVKELSVSEKIELLGLENKNLYWSSLCCKNENLFRECLLNTDNLLEPFYDILSDIKSAEDMKMLLEIINHYSYFDFSDNEHGYSEQASRITSELFYTVKNNFSTIIDNAVKNELIKLNNNMEPIMKSMFRLIYYHEFENNENGRAFIKFMLGTLDLNHVYAFIFYCVLHYGSPSETVLQEEVYYFRELYLSNNEYQIIDNQKVCNLVEGTNIGHKVRANLIIWLLNNINKDLNNELIENIRKFNYLDYAKFLKIRFIFSDGSKGGHFSLEFFDEVKTNELKKDTIDEILSSYFAYISSNVESLNYYFMSEHHKAFIEKFEDYLLNFMENQLKYYNYKYKHIILYLIKDVPKVKEYLLCKKFIFKYEGSRDLYIESYFIDFFILVFEDIEFYVRSNKDDTLKKYIKGKLERVSKEGELNDYLENLYLSIDKYKYFKKTKNLKAKVLEYFEIK